MTVLLSLLTALCYGSADYLGGAAARGNPVTKVLLASHGASLLVVLLAVLLLPAATVTGPDVAWSLVAGMLCLVGLSLLYRGLGGGPMAMVSAISAVTSAAMPVVAGVLGGEALSPLSWVGIGLGILAVLLVSVGPSLTRGKDPRWLTILFALGGGAGVGLLLVALSHTSDAAGFVPLVIVRLVTVLAFVVIVVARSNPRRVRDLLPSHPLWAGAAGTLDVAGTGLFMLAAAMGSLSVAGVVAAQYPVVTVGFARVKLGERLTTRQVVGLVAALVAVGLLAVAS